MGPGPLVSKRAMCLCFCPKLNDAAVGFDETTTFLYPTIKSTSYYNRNCAKMIITKKRRKKRVVGCNKHTHIIYKIQTVILYSINTHLPVK